ncbi:uncharacterized protein [Watersipora subatra]|uniref:uncharacterized protein n=1 Tax=Watersipora subatra TaxID=2589382 RepID=UPI00355BEDF5
MASRVAMTVNDVWERFETVKTFAKARRQIDLSKRDIEFLLEYREKHEAHKEELVRRLSEIDSIKQILQAMTAGATGESSLQDLVKLALPDAKSETVTKVHQMAIITNISKLAVKDSIDRVKNGNKIPIPRDSNSTPAFYNITKGCRKKVLSAEKDLERATRLWLWVKSQTTKQAKEKVSEGQEKGQGLHKTQSSGSVSSLVPAPVPSKTPHHSSCGGLSGSVSSNTSYQCHLLLNRHQASSSIKDPGYKKLINLEEKLKYLLDQLQLHQLQAFQNSKQANTSATPQTQACSIALQTEEKDFTKSVEKMEVSSQTSPVPSEELDLSLSSNRLQDEVFLPNSEPTTRGECVNQGLCSNCKSPFEAVLKREHLQKTYDESGSDSSHQPSTLGSRKMQQIERQFSLASQLPENSEWTKENNDSVCQDTQATDPSTEEVQELLSIKGLYENLLEKTSTGTKAVGARLDRRRSAPAVQSRRHDSVAEQERITAILPVKYNTINSRVEVTSRAVSAMSAGYSPAKRRTVRHKNAETQTDKIVDPENATAEELLGEDVPEVAGQPSSMNYSRQVSSGKWRSVASPDSVENILWLVSRKLKEGEWKILFRKLMNNIEEVMVVPEEINECITEIEEKHGVEVMKAVASLDKWRQTNGRFTMNTLLESLKDIRRVDVANDVQRLIQRPSRDCYR